MYNVFTNYPPSQLSSMLFLIQISMILVDITTQQNLLLSESYHFFLWQILPRTGNQNAIFMATPNNIKKF